MYLLLTTFITRQSEMEVIVLTLSFCCYNDAFSLTCRPELISVRSSSIAPNSQIIIVIILKLGRIDMIELLRTRI